MIETIIYHILLGMVVFSAVVAIVFILYRGEELFDD